MGRREVISVSFEQWVSPKNVSNPVISPDGKTGNTKVIDMGLPLVNGISCSKLTGRMATTGRTYTGLTEIFITSPNQPLKKITNNMAQKLIIYKDLGHGINKPKERLAAIWHNWVWFNKYVFGEEELMPD